jgi:hypothetical protein
LKAHPSGSKFVRARREVKDEGSTRVTNAFCHSFVPFVVKWF